MFASGAFAQTSWLDRPIRNWNTTANVPPAPRASGDIPTSAACRETVRAPETINDRAVTRAGWSLFGAAQTYGGVTLVNALTSVDGMCRPLQYNAFVFVGNRFAGTLSPDVMDSRTDGALTEATLLGPAAVSAQFARYTSTDALCCPSQKSTVAYQISRSLVQAQNVATDLTCQTQTEEPVDRNVVTGTVTYTEGRTALPRLADLVIRLVDISNPNASGRVVSEQTIRLNRPRLPIAFTLRFEEKDIQFRNDYAVEAEIKNGSQVLFKSTGTQKVLTRGNPSNVDLVLVSATEPIRDGLMSGTITYRVRLALARDAEIRTKLVDVSGGNTAETIIAEESFSADNRQVPIPFQLRYERNAINTRNRYVVRAEIFTDGKRIFATDTDYAVITQGNPSANIVLTLVQAGDEKPAIITGQSFNLSKFGTGSLSIEGRSDKFIVSGSVRVQTDGQAEVNLRPFGSSISFNGNLIYMDDSTLRIRVTNSGDADASGEIEVKYSGRNLNSISSTELVLDGQKASISF